MDVTVIICTYNRADLLGDSIRAIQRQVYSTDSFEIIVVDNNSKDDTEKVVRACSLNSPVQISYIFEDKQGLSHARNTGIKNAQGKIVAFVDDDIDAEPEWLSSIVNAFNDPIVVAAGGPIRPVWPSEKPDWLAERWQGLFTINEYPAARESGEYKLPHYPWGANMAFRKDVITLIGMFSTDLGRVGSSLLSCEEKCLFNRIYATGGKVAFAPNAVIHHKIPGERMSKLWLYHRTYWQGRSDAVIDLNQGKNTYRNLLKNMSNLSSFSVLNGANDFDRKCMKKAAFGYIYQVLTNDRGKGDFRRQRALKILLRSLMEIAPSAKNNASSVNEEVVVTPNILVQELLRQKDEQISALLNSLSWKITKPLRTIYAYLISFKQKNQQT